jgi:hypothetical protein
LLSYMYEFTISLYDQKMANKEEEML